MWKSFIEADTTVTDYLMPLVGSCNGLFSFLKQLSLNTRILSATLLEDPQKLLNLPFDYSPSAGILKATK